MPSHYSLPLAVASHFQLLLLRRGVNHLLRCLLSFLHRSKFRKLKLLFNIYQLQLRHDLLRFRCHGFKVADKLMENQWQINSTQWYINAAAN